MSETTAEFWDGQAATFDEEADHGLRDPAVRAAWRELLLSVLPAAPAGVLDLGCGTGSLAVLLAEAGYRAHGLDHSGQMIAAARSKADAAGVDVSFAHGDASNPPYEPGSYDVVLARHVLWAMPDPDAALGRWVRLLRPGGRLVLVEGCWCTGGGITGEYCAALVRRHRGEPRVQMLDDPALWGRQTDDERYLLVSG